MSGFETVRVPLGERTYDILIGAGLTARAGELIAPLLRRRRLAVVTEARVAALHLGALEGALGAAGIETVSLALVPGEGTKGWAGLEAAVEWLIAQKVGRWNGRGSRPSRWRWRPARARKAGRGWRRPSSG